MSYDINKKYFDIIDTEEKAYWVGFWWCDGYVCRRERLNRYNNKKIEYNFKCSLAIVDKNHLEKFRTSLNSSHPIKIYENPSAFKKKDSNDKVYEARLFITNTYMGTILQEKYGLIPHRYNCEKLVNNIPYDLMKHFIRGVLDADGSFSWYQTSDHGYEVLKCKVQFSTYEMLIGYIEKYLYNQDIILNAEHKIEQRHKDRDEFCRTLHLSGRIQAIKVLNYLYKDATIYLDRKFEKYNKIIKDCV